jgi:hypothetical protein
VYEIESISRVDPADLSAVDLRNEAAKDLSAQAYRVWFAGVAQRAEVVYFPRMARIGVAFGANAVWTDCLAGQRIDAAVRDAVERVVNESTKWCGHPRLPGEVANACQACHEATLDEPETGQSLAKPATTGSRVRILNPEPGAPTRGTVVATRDSGRVLVLLDGDDINTSFNEGEFAPEEDPANGTL